MHVDVQSLGTFNRLAHEGAQQATRSMAEMTGISASVDVTKISLLDRADAGETLGDDAYVGVEFGFEGPLSGEAVLVFDEESTDEIVAALLGEAGESMARSGVEEIGNVMMSGFIDGWADHLGATIDHTPPSYIERSGGDVLPDPPEASDHDQLFLFQSEIDCPDAAVNVSIYMLPEYGSMTELLAEQGAADEAIPIEKLEVFNRMTRQGAETAAENVEAMAGIPTEAEVSRISFAPIEDVPKQIGTETYVGTVVEFTGAPSGYLLVLFDEASAVTVAEALMPVEVEGEGLTDRHEAAIEELGNIVTSGFVDGWANVLQQSVDHTPPRLVHDMGKAIIDPLAAQLGQHQRHAFIIDSAMRTEELAFESEIYALPDGEELREALAALDVDRADETDADPEQIF